MNKHANINTFSLTTIAALLVTFGLMINSAYADSHCGDSLSGNREFPVNVACGINNTAGKALTPSGNTQDNTAVGVGNYVVQGGSTGVGAQNFVYGVTSTAVGNGNYAYGNDTSILGVSNIVGSDTDRFNNARNSSAFGNNNVITTGPNYPAGGSIAMGDSNTIGSAQATAIGANNIVGATSEKSTVVGYGNSAYGTSSLAMGASSTVGTTLQAANNAAAIGTNAKARADGTVAIGNAALAGTDVYTSGTSFASTNAIAVGTNARVYGTSTTTGADSIAIGNGATSTGNASVSVGPAAITTGNNSVALGSNSNDNGRSNVVSVGNSSAGGQRQITNVAAGTQGTDAVNLNQLNSSQSYMQNQINGVQNQVNNNKAGIAGVTAATNLPGLNHGQNFNLGVAMGSYASYAGFAIGGNVRVAENVALKASVATTAGVSSGGVGVAIGF